MRIDFRGLALIALLLPAAVIVCGCGQKIPEGALMVPRGSTLSVSTVGAISSLDNPAGSGFLASLDVPLTRGELVFAPLGSQVDGVVDAVEETPEGLSSISIRLTSLRLPDGSSASLETNPITRNAKSAVGVAGQVRADSGIEGKITRLAEVGGAVGGAAAPDAGSTAVAAVIPAGSTMVFTLAKDLIIPLQ